MPDKTPESSTPQDLLNKIVFEHYKEKKEKQFWRKWRRIFLAVLLIIGCFYFLYVHKAEITAKAAPHVGLIDLKGEIFDSQAASADNLGKSLKAAYDNEGLKAIIFRIDSPGGSPVQADYMFNTIRYYHTKYPNIKSYAVCMDTCASAAYYVAAAADEIYANPSSLVGSIGVLYNGFGFVDVMQKVGITRRLETAGVNKSFMDPFSPVDPVQEKSLQEMLSLIHQRFISQVKLGRGDRLKLSDDLFSGMVWTGEQAKARGLIDGFASSGQLLRDVIKIENVYDYTEKYSVFDQLSKNLSSELVNKLSSMLGIRPTGIH